MFVAGVYTYFCCFYMFCVHYTLQYPAQVRTVGYEVRNTLPSSSFALLVDGNNNGGTCDGPLLRARLQEDPVPE